MFTAFAGVDRSVTSRWPERTFQKRVTQPFQSGKLSQLHYRRFPVQNPASFWIDEQRIWQVRRSSRRIKDNLTASRAILQAFDAYFPVLFLCQKTI
jgi:hypothetical protein